MTTKTFATLLLASTLTVTSAFSKELETYPGELALNVDSSSGKMEIRSFPKANCRYGCSMLPIYVYDGDTLNHSNCDIGCIGPWSPVLATDPNQGNLSHDWTLITRKDGTKQWAYRGRPIYTHYSDSANVVTGDMEENGKWHHIEPNNNGELVPFPGNTSPIQNALYTFPST